MTSAKDIRHSSAFYAQLFSKAMPTIIVVFFVGVLNVWFLDTFVSWVWSILLLTVFKMFFILRPTFIQLSKIIAQSHLLSHVLAMFGLLIGLIVLSFATDYATAYLSDTDIFRTDLINGIPRYIVFYEFVYFSLISFYSVGFGDIVPITYSAKSLVMLEIPLSFIVLFFGIANVNNKHIQKENNNDH